MNIMDLCSWFTKLSSCSNNRAEIDEWPIYFVPPMFSPSVETLNETLPSIEPTVDFEMRDRKPRLPKESMPAFITETRARTPSALAQVHMPTDSRKRTLKASNTRSGTRIFETIDSIGQAKPIAPHTEDKANSTGAKNIQLPFKPVYQNIRTKTQATAEIHDSIPKVVSIVAKPERSEMQEKISSMKEHLDPEFQRILDLVNAMNLQSDNRKYTKYSAKANEASLPASKSTKIPTTATNLHLRRRLFTDQETSQKSFDLSPTEDAPKPPKFELLRTSKWYNNLTETPKMIVDHQLEIVSKELNEYHSSSARDKRLDLTFVMENVLLQQVLRKLDFYITDYGMLEKVPQMLRTPGFLRSPSVPELETTNYVQMLPNSRGTVTPGFHQHPLNFHRSPSVPELETSNYVQMLPNSRGKVTPGFHQHPLNFFRSPSVPELETSNYVQMLPNFRGTVLSTTTPLAICPQSKLNGGNDDVPEKFASTTIVEIHHVTSNHISDIADGGGSSIRPGVIGAASSATTPVAIRTPSTLSCRNFDVSEKFRGTTVVVEYIGKDSDIADGGHYSKDADSGCSSGAIRKFVHIERDESDVSAEIDLACYFEANI